MICLPIKDQTTIYIQWCKDNKKQPKDYNSLKDYFNEIESIMLVKGGAF